MGMNETKGDRRMTDITKFKSVAIKIDAYKLAKPMANEKYMSMGAFIRYLIDKEHEQKTNGKDQNHDRTKSD
jgi:hypothetical protein